MSPRPIPAPPEGYLAFVNGDHVNHAGYSHKRNDEQLLAYVAGAWHPVTFVHRTNPRSVDLSYSTGPETNDKGRQRIAPERVAAPAEQVETTWDGLESGDELVEANVVDDLLGRIAVAGRGYGTGGRPFVDACVIARDGSKEIVRRTPETAVVVRRVRNVR